MNHHETADTPPTTSHHTFSNTHNMITTVVLLLIVYYGIPFITYHTTIKRSAYELLVRLVPSHLIYMMQHLTLSPEQADSQLLRRESFNGPKAKGDALQQLYEDSSLTKVVQKARSLSGYSKIMITSTEVAFPGLGNWDNSCYQNSTLQGLASLPAFYAYIDRSLRLCKGTGTPILTQQALIEFLAQLNEGSFKPTTLWTPKILKSMDSWQQQDAQEYLSRVLDAVEKEALASTKILARRSMPGLAKCDGTYQSSTLCREFLERLPNNPLDGFLAQTLKCQTCNYTEGFSYMQFNCLTLNLGLGGSCRLEELLEAYTEPELIEGVECDECSKSDASNSDCIAVDEDSTPDLQPAKDVRRKVLRTKAKQITIGRMPKDMVIHVNRSIFDDYGNQRKNTAMVSFPSQLSVMGRWCAPIDARADSTQAIYDLKCIVTHSGRHDNGHYVACGKRGKDWFIFNDEYVTRIAEEEVLRRGNVFMLFYEIRDQLPTTIDDTADAAVVEELGESASVCLESTSATNSASDITNKVIATPLPQPISILRTSSQTNIPQVLDGGIPAARIVSAA